MRKGRKKWEPDPSTERYRFTDRMKISPKTGRHSIPDSIWINPDCWSPARTFGSVLYGIKTIETIPNLYNYLVAEIPCKREPHIARQMIDELLDLGCISKITD